jgi:hypothetical protein
MSPIREYAFAWWTSEAPCAGMCACSSVFVNGIAPASLEMPVRDRDKVVILQALRAVEELPRRYRVCVAEKRRVFSKVYFCGTPIASYLCVVVCSGRVVRMVGCR